jgi:hypothetical protein
MDRGIRVITWWKAKYVSEMCLFGNIKRDKGLQGGTGLEVVGAEVEEETNWPTDSEMGNGRSAGAALNDRLLFT